MTFNPMQYVKIRHKQETYELFNDDCEDGLTVPTISYEQYKALTDYLKKKDNPALLPIQIAYYTGLWIGEVCALTWQDIDLKEQTITVRRSMRYNGARHKTEVAAPPSGAKSARWTSATRWRTSSKRQRPSSTKIVLSTASYTA